MSFATYALTLGLFQSWQYSDSLNLFIFFGVYNCTFVAIIMFPLST